jgi:hypothetical protein
MRVSVDREPQRVLALWSSYNQKPSDPSDKRHVSSPNEMGIRYPRFQRSSSGLPAVAIGTMMSNETASFVSYQLQPPKGRWRGSSKRVCLNRAPEVRVQYTRSSTRGILTDRPASIGTAELCLPVLSDHNDSPLARRSETDLLPLPLVLLTSSSPALLLAGGCMGRRGAHEVNQAASGKVGTNDRLISSKLFPQTRTTILAECARPATVI